MLQISETYKSSSGPGDYTTGVAPNGLLTCGCPGWINKREGMPRWCKHCKRFCDEHPELKFEERDEQYFLVSGKPVRTTKPAVTAPEPVPGQNAFVQPMKAIKTPDWLTADDFEAESYVMEEKFDGHRLIVQVALAGRGGGVNVAAWSGGEKSRTLPAHIHDVMVELAPGLYDGELIVPGKHSYDVTAGMNSGTEVLVLFDVLESLGVRSTHLPFKERRQVLRETFKVAGLPRTAWATSPRKGPVQLISQYEPSQGKVEEIWKRGGEGVVIKHLDSTYQPGYRSDQWLKIKAVASAILTIVGYEPGKVGPYSAVRIRDEAGIETTVKTLDNATMRSMEGKPSWFIGKRLVISYQEKTPSGKYRHPMWDHLAGKGEK